jgi:hypothetical protein
LLDVLQTKRTSSLPIRKGDWIRGVGHGKATGG